MVMAVTYAYSNCNGVFIHDVLSYARIEPQVLQVEIHPYLTQDALVQYCKRIGLAITAYSSFGPQGYVEIDAHKGAGSLLEHSAITSIAEKSGKSRCNQSQ